MHAPRWRPSGTRPRSTTWLTASSVAATTSPMPSAEGSERVPDLRERLLYPRAGWLSLGLLLVMALALSWAVQGANWLEQLEFLPPVAFWAILAGAVLGVLPISVVATLPLGALLGAGVVLWTIGGEYHVALDQIGRVEALRDDLVGWTITVMRTGYPSQLSPYAIGLGILL